MELTYNSAIIKRDSGDGRGSRSVVGQSAYISRSKCIDRDGQNYDYRRVTTQSDYVNRRGDFEEKGKDLGERVAASGVILPEGRTLESLGLNNGIDLWTRIENEEDRILGQRFRRDQKRADREIMSASPAHRIIISIHNSIPPDQAGEIIENFIREHITSRGMVAEFSIHDKPGNLHAHIIHSARILESDGTFSKSKCRSIADPTNYREFTLEGRATIARLQNEKLAALGIEDRVEFQSYSERGIEKERTTHRGVVFNTAQEIGAISMPDSLYIESEKLAQNVAASLGQRHAVWTERQFLRSLAQESGGDSIQTEAGLDHLSKLVESGVVVELDAAAGKFTTADYVTAEKSAFESAKNLADRQSVNIDLAGLESRLDRDYAFLSAEQKSAALHIAGAGDLKLMVGLAGSGKTTLLKSLVDQAQAEGKRVVGVSLAGVAVDGLTRAAGVDVAATIAAWKFAEGRAARGQTAEKAFQPGDLILIDEAGMIGTRDMRDLLNRAEKVGAKVVLIGDPDQLSPIDAGSPFSELLSRHPSARVEEIRRQREGWQREASQAFADGRILDGLKAYADRGHVHIIDDPIQKITSDYVADLSARPDGSRLALAGLKDEVAQINESIRNRLIESGHLSEVAGEFQKRTYYIGERVAFTSNDSGSLVRESSQDAAVMLAADFQEKALQAVRNRHSREWDDFKSSRRFITRNMPSILAPFAKMYFDARYQRLKRYQKKEIEHRKSMLAEAQKQARGMGVRNGEFGLVEGLNQDGSLRVRLDSGRTVDISAAPNQWGQKYDGLSAGYAASATVHKNQGATVDKTYDLSSKNTDRNAAYVSATRHRDELNIYADSAQFRDFQAIAESWDRRGGKESIADFDLKISVNPLVNRIKKLRESRQEYAREMAGLARSAKAENCFAWELDPAKWRALSDQRRQIRKEAREIGGLEWKSIKNHARAAGVNQAELMKWSGQSRLTNEQIAAQERVEKWAEKVEQCRDGWNALKSVPSYQKTPDFAAWQRQKMERDRMAAAIMADESGHRRFIGEVGLTLATAKKMSQDHDRRQQRQAGQSWQPAQAPRQQGMGQAMPTSPAQAKARKRINRFQSIER